MPHPRVLQVLPIRAAKREIPFRSAFLLTKVAAITLQLKRDPGNQPQGPEVFSQKTVPQEEEVERPSLAVLFPWCQ